MINKPMIFGNAIARIIMSENPTTASKVVVHPITMNNKKTIVIYSAMMNLR